MPNTIQVKDASSNIVTLDTQGTPETGQSLAAGGYGPMGWLSSLRKAITDRLPAALVGGRLDVNVGASGTLPISAVALPLPSGAALDSTLTARLPAALGSGGGIKADITSGSVGLAKGTRTNSTAAPTTTAASVLAVNASRKVALIANAGTQAVYLGTAGTVTTANGYPLLPGAELVDDVSTGAWFAIVGAGTGDLRIVEVA